jgi:glycosyltransferase involved in cell wall biosynthesis
MSNPLVSALIDTYNHERFIEQAVESVLAQDFPSADREILVVDDGSTDKTPELLRKFGPRLRILRKANGGQASAFNHGIPECRGQIVAFLGEDDWWAPNKLSSVAAAFAADPAVYVSYVPKLLVAYRVTFVDASHWILDDTQVDDPLHLGQSGAEEFSRRLGTELRAEIATVPALPATSPQRESGTP